MNAGQTFGEPIREGDVFNREPVHIQPFVIESWSVHHDPFEYEYEYEYRAAPEYEYDQSQNVLTY